MKPLNPKVKKVLNILKSLLLIIILVLTVGAGVLFISDKLLGQNSFQSIAASIDKIIHPQPAPEPEAVDTTPLKVQSDTQSTTIFKATTAITVRTNKEVSIDDSTKYKLTLVKKDTDTTEDFPFWYALEISNIGVGNVTLSVDIKDKVGNKEPVVLAVTRESYTLPFGLKQIDDWPNATFTADGNNFLAKVNKEHKLIDDYAPTDLVNLNTDYQLYTNTASIMLRKEPADYLKLMLNDLKKATGKNAVIASGYRSYAEQYKLYADWVRQLGQAQADNVSARPGFSEHQLGSAIDFVDQETGLTLTNDFQKDVTGKWLLDNSYKYGFIQSYPEGKEAQTGYSHEAWHYRYIGIDDATKVHDSGLTLKEWLDKNA